jgi:hypothetical protein
VSALIPVKIQRVLILLMILLIIMIQMMLQAAEVKSNTGWGDCTDTCEVPDGSIVIADNNATNYVTGS